jgi:4'-phosphopantetheinyl transferase
VSVDDFSSAGNSTSQLLRPNAIASPAAGVGLWWARLTATDRELAELSSSLSPAEHARAARFGRDSLRRRYIVGRALLRKLLGSAVDLAPGAVPIVRGARGRPRLDGIQGIDFNVSHTQDMSLVGISRGPRIGVDIERADRDVNADGLSRKFLSEQERAALEPLTADERRLRFLRYWTCKEAMSKATGDGIAAPFRRMEVALGEAIELVHGPSPYEPQHWRLFAVDVPRAYLGTLAMWNDG